MIPPIASTAAWYAGSGLQPAELGRQLGRGLQAHGDLLLLRETDVLVFPGDGIELFGTEEGDHGDGHHRHR
jgi:hypothetical protein